MTSFVFHFLRSRRCRRWAAAWVLMGWFAAYATVLVQPASWVLVCSSGSMVVALVDDDGATPQQHNRPLCPLCVLDAAGLPPPQFAAPLPLHAAVHLPPPPPLSSSAPLVALARGPPFIL